MEMIGRLPTQGNADKPLPMSRSAGRCQRSRCPKNIDRACRKKIDRTCRKKIDRVLPNGFVPHVARRCCSVLCRGRLRRSLRSRARYAEPDGTRLSTAVRSIFENDSRRANLNFRRKKAAKIPFPHCPADLSRLHYNAIPEPCQAAVFSFFQAYFSQISMIWNKLGEIDEKNMSNARESV